MWKNLLTRFRYAGFTKNEAMVILFLTGVTLTGGTIRYFQSGSQPQPEDYAQAYRLHDSLFADRSQALPLPEIDSGEITLAGFQEKSKKSSKEASLGSTKININKASAEQLAELPGVGPSTAEKIVEYRKSTGGFKRIEDIMNVKGIGIKKFEKMKPYITVEK